jgi:hypothetical protein
MKTFARTLGVCLAVVAVLNLVGCACGNCNTNSQPSFTLSSSPGSATVGQGGIVSTTITVNPQNGFTGSVALSASGLPTGVTAAFNPTSTSTTSVLSLSAASSTAMGTTSVIVIGASGSLMPTTPVSLTVATPSVNVSVSPAIAAVAAATQTQQFTQNVTGNMGNSNVTWSVDNFAGGNATVGTIDATGLYTPPSTGGTHTVTATSTVLTTSSGSATVAVTDLGGVFTYHNDLARDGANTQEYALNSSTVTTSKFGKLFSCAVDGAVYTQPLWVPGLSIGGGTHNVIFVATQHDSVYAFDADASPCVTYWKANLLGANENPVVWNEVGNCYGDVYPEVGVTGTPVIDPSTNTIYLVSASEVGGAGAGGACSGYSGTFYHRLHALDLASGSEKFNAPVTIAASVPGAGDGSSGGIVSFTSQLEHNRSGLALNNGTVYVAFAAHEDASPYHGWLLGYSAADLSQAPSVFNTTPNGGLGGIWAGGGAPAIDATGDVYAATGNGVFDANATTMPFNDYGDSILRLHPFSGVTPNGTNLQLNGWFTPFDQQTLSNNDTDLGSGAPVLLPDQATSPTHLLAHLGKDGVVYLVDRDNMGYFNSGTNNVVQYFQVANGFWGTAAFWQNNLYFAGALDGTTDYLKQFSFYPATGQFCSSLPCSPSPASQSTQQFGFPDVTPSVSSQGSSNGIVWALDERLYGYASLYAAGGVDCHVDPPPAACSGPAILHAYDATNLANELWNTTQAANNRDHAGNAVKFVPPTVANGKVYVSTRTEIDVYGLLPSSGARAKFNARKH